jgi:uncharacterized protein (DUF924 family)
MNDTSTPQLEDWKTVYDFWFPASLDDADLDAHVQMVNWWMQGGANAQLGRFVATVEAAKSGRLKHWLTEPRGRLSLIIVLDQFPRGLFAGTPDAYASDEAALRIVEEGIENRHFDSLSRIWERLFFLLPMVHTEGPDHLARLQRLIETWQSMSADVPEHLAPLYRGAVGRARANVEIISTYGRFPHRNAALGRQSTPQEEAYIQRGDFVYTRPVRLGSS